VYSGWHNPKIQGQIYPSMIFSHRNQQLEFQKISFLGKV
jgi:hypothetical protein